MSNRTKLSEVPTGMIVTLPGVTRDAFSATDEYRDDGSRFVACPSNPQAGEWWRPTWRVVAMTKEQWFGDRNR